MLNSALDKIGVNFRKKSISSKVQEIKVSPIKEMRIIAQKYDDVVSFGQGIPYLNTPVEIRERLSRLLLEKDISKYSISPGLFELREKLAKKLKNDHEIVVDPKKEIIITNGGMEGIFISIMTLVEPGDEVIMFTPGFSSHIEQVMLSGGIPIFSKLNPEDWSINFDDLKKKITKKTKNIIISNPNNPTGSVYTKSDLLKLKELVLKNEIMLIADDPYNFLVYEGEYFSLSSLPEMKENIITCFSFSKEFAMTGYRLGYVIASEGVINQVMKVHDACAICAPVISQHAGIIALDHANKAKTKIKDALAINRKIIVSGLQSIKGISFVEPKGAYYVFVKYNRKANSVEFALDILDKVHLEVVPGSAFGPAGEGHIRLSFGGTPDKIKEGIARLSKYFGELK